MTEEKTKDVKAAIAFVKGAFPSCTKSNAQGFALALKTLIEHIEDEQPRV